MALTVVCPNKACNTKLNLGDDRADTEFNCPRCSSIIRVPPSVVSSISANTTALAGVSTVRFPCPLCGKMYRFESHIAGKKMRCKSCQGIIVAPSEPGRVKSTSAVGDAETLEESVPGTAVAAVPARPLFSPSAAPALPPPTPPTNTTPAGLPRPLWRDPVKLSLTVASFTAFWVLLFLLCGLILAAKDTTPLFLIVVMFVAFLLSAVGTSLTFQLFAAKQRALAGKSVSLLFGFAKLITWEQNEGLILLRDKRIAELIYGPRSGGGLRIIYPVLGEELRAQVPLTLQLTWFKDERVLTRESIQLAIKVALWWEVDDLEAYFYRIDREVHAGEDRGIPGAGTVTSARPTPRGRLGIAEIWVETLVESCLRKLIAETSTFLIISKRAANHLHLGAGGDPTTDLTPATPDVIAELLKKELQPRVKGYGLGIDRVEIQEVQLPPTIQTAVDEVWIASTLPTKSGHEAQALQNRLKVLVESY